MHSFAVLGELSAPRDRVRRRFNALGRTAYPDLVVCDQDEVVFKDPAARWERPAR